MLVTGAGGMLARALLRELERRGHEVAAYDRAALDVTDAGAVDSAIRAFAPGAVVQCAAYTRVDDAEAEEGRAHAVNAEATLHVARACRAAGARLVYPSTDYVFDGTGTTPYRPDSPTAPLNAYGRTKRAGEVAAEEAGDALIVRTSWLYGPDGPNFVRTILEHAREGQPLRVVDDQRGAPTWTGSLAAVFAGLLERGAPPGIYHATDGGRDDLVRLRPRGVAPVGRPRPDSSGFQPGVPEAGGAAPLFRTRLHGHRIDPRPAGSLDPRAGDRVDGGDVSSMTTEEAGLSTRATDSSREAARSVTRGSGLLEGFLAKQRAKAANRLIPAAARSGRVLDVGCGSHPYFLLNTAFAERYGIDKMVGRSGPAGAAPPGVTLIQHDLEQDATLPFDDESFEVVTMLAVFEHIEPDVLRRLLREIRRVLKPGGSYILTTPAGWTDGLLKLLARLGLVSAEEIDEHKDAYTHRKIGALLGEAGFDPASMKFGTFELFMNLWATARK